MAFDSSPANSDCVTRFAPSPTGRLHLGHAYSAWFAWEKALEAQGRFILRIEDIDTTRCRPEFIEGIYEDLSWLGLEWETPVRIQSEHMDTYEAMLDKLSAKDLLYPCFCTRKEILAEIEQSESAPHGPEGPLYPGTCRKLSADQRAELLAGSRPYALRLNLERAQEMTGALTWFDRKQGELPAEPEQLGDVVLARKDIATSYHLAVVSDDALQGVTLITRGQDLFYTTHLHRLLQELLELPVPEYEHHDLVTDAEGKRLAKRDKAITLQALREAGHSVEEIRSMWNTGA